MLSGGPCRDDDGVLHCGGKSKRREWQSPAEALLQLERNVLSPLAEMTLAPVTFSTTSNQSVLFFILAGYTSASEIRDLLVLGSTDSTFSSTLLQGAIRICPQNTQREHGQEEVSDAFFASNIDLCSFESAEPCCSHSFIDVLIDM